MQYLVELGRLLNPHRRGKDYWRPFNFVNKRLKPGDSVETQRKAVADQFTNCLTLIQNGWHSSSVSKEMEKTYGEDVGLSRTLGVRAMIKDLYSSDYLANYGQYLNDDVFNTCLLHFIKFSTESYRAGFNQELLGFKQLGEIYRNALVSQITKIPMKNIEWMFEGGDYLSKFIYKRTEKELKSMPKDFGKATMWLFGSEGDQVTERDSRLVAAHLELNTNFREIKPEELIVEDVFPFTILAKTLMREGRDPTEREVSSVASIVDSKFKI